MPPKRPTEKWQLNYQLQSTADPSLIINSKKIWQDNEDRAFLMKTHEDPSKRALADLARVAPLSKQFEQNFDSVIYSDIMLSAHDAHIFLSNTLLLQNQGLAMQLPPWWLEKRKLSATMKIKKVVGGLLSMSSIIEYDWRLSLGNEEVTEDEIKKLAALKSPLVQLRGQWIEVRSEDLEKALSYEKKKAHTQELTLFDALRLSLAQEDRETTIAVSQIKAEGPIADLFLKARNPEKASLIEIPETFNGTLRPYQHRGTSWLAALKTTGLGSCLADDMGLGKTIQVIAFILHEKNHQQGPHLIICPLSVLGNWQRELMRFAPSLSFLVHHSVDRLSDKKFKSEAMKKDVVLTTYALAVRDTSELQSITWKTTIIDEAQNIKNSSSKQAQVIKKIPALNKIALTGTPVENRLGELWSIMDFLNKGYLGAEEHFHKSFTVPIEREKNTERAQQLKRLIQPFILRRMKTDKTIIQDLPEKIETKEQCYLTKEQASLYRSIVDSMLGQIDQAAGIERKGLVLAALIKLKQICNHPVNFLQDNSSIKGRSGKIARLEELLEEILSENGKCLIFTQFAYMGDLLQRYLQETFKQEVLYLYGGTPKNRRDSMVERFQSNNGPPLFVLSLKAGGIGLNLTQANHVFHFDRWWNPAVENQATDRAFRIGQKQMVQVHTFVCAGTLEEKIYALLEQKKELANLIIGTGEQWITELSTEELRDLLMLNTVET